jgi:hypothetical protein
VAGCCKHGDKPLGFIKCRTFFDFGIINFSRRVLLHRVGWFSFVVYHVSLPKLCTQSLWDHIVASYISPPPHYATCINQEVPSYVIC